MSEPSLPVAPPVSPAGLSCRERLALSRADQAQRWSVLAPEGHGHRGAKTPSEALGVKLAGSPQRDQEGERPNTGEQESSKHDCSGSLIARVFRKFLRSSHPPATWVPECTDPAAGFRNRTATQTRRKLTRQRRASGP
jgi:hypothetical protein